MPTETPVVETPPETPSGTTRRKLIPVGMIQKDLGLQVRGFTDPAKVERFREIIQEHGSMDAVDVFHCDPGKLQFWLADGWSRVGAYEAEGIEKIPCNVRTGDHSKALEFALHKNGHHGASMTNAEKRSAAQLAVLDARIGLKTDKDIARMIGCSPTLVGQARRGETKEQSSAKTKERVERSVTQRNTVSVAAHERSAPNTPPTKAAILKQIEDWVIRDQVDEAEVIRIFNKKGAEYVWMPQPGQPTLLRVVGKSGREQVSIEVLVKELAFQQITLKNEGGKLTVEV